MLLGLVNDVFLRFSWLCFVAQDEECGVDKRYQWIGWRVSVSI